MVDTTKYTQLLSEMPVTNISPPANTFGRIFRHETKENFISDWLAFLLNPDCTGNSEPLSALLELAEVDEPVDFDDVSIVREYTFQEDHRRIDLLIETSTHVIGIENKIWSGLQDNQLEDYSQQLKNSKLRNDRKLILILLYPKLNGNIHSLCDKKCKKTGFKFVTYEELVEKFRNIRFDIFKNLRAAVLLEDFILHMEEYVMSQQNDIVNENMIMWRFAAEKQKELAELTKALKNSRAGFQTYIDNRINESIKEREDSDDWKTSHNGSKYFQLYKTCWKIYGTHFELLNCGDEAMLPTNIQVVLHTCEGKHNKKYSDLREINGSGERRYPIDYSTQENFNTSMDQVFQALDNLVKEYTPRIDEAVFKISSSKEPDFND